MERYVKLEGTGKFPRIMDLHVALLSLKHVSLEPSAKKRCIICYCHKATRTFQLMLPSYVEDSQLGSKDNPKFVSRQRTMRIVLHNNVSRLCSKGGDAAVEKLWQEPNALDYLLLDNFIEMKVALHIFLDLGVDLDLVKFRMNRSNTSSERLTRERALRDHLGLQVDIVGACNTFVLKCREKKSDLGLTLGQFQMVYVKECHTSAGHPLLQKSGATGIRLLNTRLAAASIEKDRAYFRLGFISYIVDEKSKLVLALFLKLMLTRS